MSEHWSELALGRLPEGETDRARRFFRRAAVVSPVSHDMAKRIAPLTEATKLSPVPNPVDTGLFVPATRDRSSEIRLLSVGNLVAIKGHRVLIDAMPAVLSSHPAVQLDIVGDGELRDDLERRAHDRGVASRVHFHGRLERRRVAEMMRAADVLVLPSLWETLSCVLLEAMSSGLPVVASRVGGPRRSSTHRPASWWIQIPLRRSPTGSRGSSTIGIDSILRPCTARRTRGTAMPR